MKRLTTDHDVSSLLSQMRGRHEDKLFTPETISELITEFLLFNSFSPHEEQWLKFFRSMPDAIQPNAFEVHILMQRLPKAVSLAKTKDQKKLVIGLCKKTSDYEDVVVGLALAGELEDTDAERDLEELAGDIATLKGELSKAAVHYRKAECFDRLSHCLEELGQPWEALDCTDYSSADRILHLLQICMEEIDKESANGEYTTALQHLEKLKDKLVKAPVPMDFESAERDLEELAGDIARLKGELSKAAVHYRKAKCFDRLSHCLEELGQPWEALDCTDYSSADRILHLLQICMEEIDKESANGEYTTALQHLEKLKDKFVKAPDPMDFESSTIRLDSRKKRLFEIARKDYEEQINSSAESEKRALRLRWSQFEEIANKPGRAAELAQLAGDMDRARDLFRRAGLFGTAISLPIKQVSQTESDTLAVNAKICEEAEDILGAAELYEKAGRNEEACRCYELAGRLGRAAECLRTGMDDVDCANNPKYIALMKEAGEHEELVSLLMRHPEQITLDSAAVKFLQFVAEGNVVQGVTATTLHQVRAVIAKLYENRRIDFESQLDEWCHVAREVVNSCYANIWGFDLGTTNSAAMIYDKSLGEPVECCWKGLKQFSSTLAIDVHGHERIGLTLEESLSPEIKGVIFNSKRKMGQSKQLRIGKVSYRPEMVAACIIKHGRMIIETFLRKQVIKEIKVKVFEMFGSVPEIWLEELDAREDVRIERPNVVVTVPAYFDVKQKNATRDACEIAGVNAKRLVHEPTAACLPIKQVGTIIVVDLGAGTLDISAINVTPENPGLFHEVVHVFGDNNFGGNDFDDAIYEYLKHQIDDTHGELIRNDSGLSSRLKIAAQRLKIDLSDAKHATYVLHNFARAGTIKLTLSHDELKQILHPLFTHLRKKCEIFRDQMVLNKESSDFLVLVGGSMLSPLIRQEIESVFKLRVLGRSSADPRTAVANGAAIQAAILCGDKHDLLLMDVIPQALGIAAIQDGSVREIFSEIIETDTKIPHGQTKTYSTNEDNQTTVPVKIYQGGTLDHDSLIGKFELHGIPLAPRGVPKIDVTFNIDASCVLTVTAKDQGTGNSRSIKIRDTHLLSPKEREDLKRRFDRTKERELKYHELETIRESIREIRDEFTKLKLSTLAGSWRKLRDGFRPPTQELEGSVNKILQEMFQNKDATENEIRICIDTMRDLSVNSEELLAKKIDLGADVNLEKMITSGRDISPKLKEQLRKAKELVARIEMWKEILVKAEASNPNPLRRLEIAHETGKHDMVIAEFDKLNPADHYPNIIERYLDSISLSQRETSETYKSRFLVVARQLGVTPIENLDKLDVWCASVRTAVAFIECKDGTGSGFLVTSDAVATNKHVVVQEDEVACAANLSVFVGGHKRAVKAVQIADTGIDLAVLHLEEPVDAMHATPFRCGPGCLVKAGMKVAGMGFPTPRQDQQLDDNFSVSEGIVERLYKDDQQYPDRRFQVSFPLRPGISGGPLVNILGEVVGLLTMARISPDQNSPPEFFAISTDPLWELIGAPWQRRDDRTT